MCLDPEHANIPIQLRTFCFHIEAIIGRILQDPFYNVINYFHSQNTPTTLLSHPTRRKEPRPRSVLLLLLLFRSPLLRFVYLTSPLYGVAVIAVTPPPPLPSPPF